jgi:ferrous iron transport protein B
MTKKDEPFLVALVGQPNCGKSTFFNAIAGFKADTGNYPGTTVAITETTVTVSGRKAKVVDLPGTYSLLPADEAEEVTRRYLMTHNIHSIICVVDASVLARSLEFVLEVSELQKPMVVCLNMMDQAVRKGVKIDVKKLEEVLGVKVVPAIATTGKGVKETLEAALFSASVPKMQRYDKDVEEAVQRLIEKMPDTLGSNRRYYALRLLEQDEGVEKEVQEKSASLADFAGQTRKDLAEMHDWPEDEVLSFHRHAVALSLFEKVATVERREKRDIEHKLDSIVTHPFFGFVVAFLVFALVFSFAFFVGDFLASLIEKPFDTIKRHISPEDSSSLWAFVLSGFLSGIEAGVGIVLPYLIPLLLLLSFLEELGYLPRLAFLLDGLMHKVGLHGKSVIPLVLGYGCNVPAIMATRIMENPRDKILTALLIPFVICSARTVVILALVGALFGPLYAFAFYFVNIVITAVISTLFSRLLKGQEGGLLIDVPDYHFPPIAILLKKTWFRIYEFIVSAWPILVLGSLVMSVLSFLRVDSLINHLFEPLTASALGLPEETGITLFFGFLRKELTLTLLSEALGTKDYLSILSPGQIFTFVTFVVFYIPCLATFTVMKKELGLRIAILSALSSTLVALLFAMLVRLGFAVV